MGLTVELPEKTDQYACTRAAKSRRYRRGLFVLVVSSAGPMAALAATGPASATPLVSKQFAIPTASSGPNGIVIGPDRAAWFTESAANQIGRFSPRLTPLNPAVRGIRRPDPRQQALWHHCGSRRCSLVHRGPREQDRPDHGPREDQRVPNPDPRKSPGGNRDGT